MNPTLVWGAIAGMAVTNIVLRFVPIAALSRVRLPRRLEQWLSYVPVCVMSGIVTSAVLRPGGTWLPPLDNPYLLAAVPTALTYRFTRSLLGSTVVGVSAFLAFRYLLG